MGIKVSERGIIDIPQPVDVDASEIGAAPKYWFDIPYFELRRTDRKAPQGLRVVQRLK